VIGFDALPTSLPGLRRLTVVPLPAQEPPADVLALTESTLARVRGGEIRSIGIAVAYDDGCIGSAFAGEGHIVPLLSALAVLNARVMRRVEP
jgi:hypothetical protein